MNISIDPVKNQREIRTLSEFLSAMAVNKGFYWTIHLASQLEWMQRLGESEWQRTIGWQKSEYSTELWKKKNGYGGKPYGQYTGQTYDQARFAEGSARIRKTGTTFITQVVSPAWTPGRGERPFKNKNSRSDRPFWMYNGIYRFFDKNQFTALESASRSIWKKEITGDATLTDAKRALIMSVPQTKKLLSTGEFNLGSWHKSKPKGVASRWH